MKRRFKVPLRITPCSDEVYIKGLIPPTAIEYELSDTYVLQAPGGLSSDWHVELVRDAQRRVGSTPLYQFFSRGFWERAHGNAARPIRLGVFKPGSLVAIERPSNREQVVYTDDGGVKHIVSGWGYHCVNIACDSKERKTTLQMGVPTCPKCLAAVPKTVWVLFIVQPYDHPAHVEKAKNKAKAKARIRSRYPTAYDKLTKDWLEEDTSE